MFGLSTQLTYYLYRVPTDMRKSIDGLSGLVINRLGRNPSEGSVYIFINRTRDKIKLLQWQEGGFVLYYKRLEKGTFQLPMHPVSSEELSITYGQLVLLIEGLSIVNLQAQKRYKKTM